MPYEFLRVFLFNFFLPPTDECMFTHTMLDLGMQIHIYVGEDLYYPDENSHVISTTQGCYLMIQHQKLNS